MPSITLTPGQLTGSIPYIGAVSFTAGSTVTVSTNQSGIFNEFNGRHEDVILNFRRIAKYPDTAYNWMAPIVDGAPTAKFGFNKNPGNWGDQSINLNPSIPNNEFPEVNCTINGATSAITLKKEWVYSGRTYDGKLIRDFSSRSAEPIGGQVSFQSSGLKVTKYTLIGGSGGSGYEGNEIISIPAEVINADGGLGTVDRSIELWFLNGQSIQVGNSFSYKSTINEIYIDKSDGMYWGNSGSAAAGGFVINPMNDCEHKDFETVNSWGVGMQSVSGSTCQMVTGFTANLPQVAKHRFSFTVGPTIQLSTWELRMLGRATLSIAY